MTLTVSRDEWDHITGRIWGLIQDASHLDCEGWSFDSREGVVICACGAHVLAVVST